MVPMVDFHVHTNLSACAARDMTLDAIVRECQKAGLVKIGITDHLNRPEHAESNAVILKDIRALRTDLEVYFGAEVNYGWKLKRHPLSQERKEELGYQYAIGSHHSTYLREYDLAKIIETQHRHHLLTCADPAMDILGHPYRFLKPEFDNAGWPWFDNVDVVPRKILRELAAAAKQTGTAVEINSTSNLCNKFQGDAYRESYIELLRVLADEGVTFALGSDAHELHEFETNRLCRDVVERLGIPEDRVWMPRCSPASAAID